MKRLAVVVMFFLACMGQPQTVRQLGAWAKALVYRPGTDDKQAEYERDHKAALNYIHHVDRVVLRKDMLGVRHHFGVFSGEGIGATYVMALHGIDLSQNLKIMSKYIIGSRAAEDILEEVPAAFADIALRQRSRDAARRLVALKTDGAMGEEQWFEAARVYFKDPDLIVSAVAPYRSLWGPFLEDLQEGVGEPEGTTEDARRLAHQRGRNARGAVKALYEKIEHLPSP